MKNDVIETIRASANPDKSCFCHNCICWYHFMGIARHRAMHKKNREIVEITYSTGETYIHDFSKIKGK